MAGLVAQLAGLVAQFGRTGGAVCKGATPLPELLEGLILSWAANPHLSSGLVTALRAFMMLTCWD
jgi:hypothetical protein